MGASKRSIAGKFASMRADAIRVRQDRCAKVRNRNVACLKCAEACTSGCISIVDDELVIDSDKCVGCGTCATVCPTCALESVNPTDAEQAMVDQDALKEYQWSNADVEGAKKLLDDAGIVDTDGDGIREYNGKNLSYKAECPTGWSDWNATLEIVAAAGKNIGINIETYFPEAANYNTDYSTGNFEITMQSGPGTSVANPYMRCRFFMSSDYNDLEVNFSGNFGHYQNDRVDEILAAIPHETDDAKLKDYYTELSKIMLEDCPCVPLMYRPQVFHEVNESVWTNYPQKDDGTNVPPMDCTDGYGVAALYNLELIDG